MADGAPYPPQDLRISLGITLGPSDPWAQAVSEFDQMRAEIRKLPDRQQPAAWGRLTEHIRAARAEILGPPGD
ncbi:MAG TPA: hypothetical protein VK545_16360 [Streptomyces sp.]|nr:hypothetical protein [Streptomyces sp.]